MAKVSLVLEFNNRVMTIPFKDISLLDEFTVSCSDKDELTNKLKDVYDITITGNIYKADIQYIVNNRKVFYLPIKYSEDDFEIEDLISVYKKYYEDDHTRIKTTEGGIKYVKHDTINAYLHGKEITNTEIDHVVNSFFKGSYKKYRDAYFTLKRYGYKVKCKSHLEKIDLSKYDTEDTYFQSLLRAAEMGMEDKAIEELSLQDIEDIINNFPGLFDGAKDENKRGRR